ncbi:glycosyltransferase family 9 protein [Oxalobacteraceae bacterium A2-2]
MKVLFFSQDGKLGDAVVNTAFVAALRRAAPDCEIHATVAGATAAFWGADPRIGKLWSLWRPGWGDTVRAGLAMRRERYDYIVTWQRLRKEKNKLLLWLANPGKVIDLRAYNAGPLQHKVTACAAVLREMGLPCEDEPAYEIGMPACCAEIDAQLPPGREVVLLNLFAADPERNVPQAQAVALVRGLRAQAAEARLCLVCTKATEAQARAVADASAAGAEVVNCDGNLPRLLRLCQRADLTISPDTALVHISSAYGRAVIGIYQNNGVKAVQWGPRTALAARVLSTSADSIAGFAVDEVLDQAAALRAAYARPSAVLSAR